MLTTTDLRRHLQNCSRPSEVLEEATSAGARLVDLDPKTVRVLREQRKRQAELRILVGTEWTDHDLVFTRKDGRPHDPGRITNEFQRRIERWGLRRIRLHDLRHTWATATNGCGTSTPSTPSNRIVPIGPPDAPAGFQAQGGNASASLHWNPSVEHGTPVTGYHVAVTPPNVASVDLPNSQHDYNERWWSVSDQRPATLTTIEQALHSVS